jgi:holo-[acyl-carrier protein] synthase
MIKGIGTDLVEIARIELSLSRWGDRFCRKILDESEMEGFKRSVKKAHFLAKRFAAKEAASKALGTGMRQGVTFQQLRVSHNDSGAPFIVFTGKAQQLATSMGVEVAHLSISDEQSYALAFVILSGNP